jgi:alpha-galactosidase
MDDCWQYSRDAQGTIQPNPRTFPNGIPALADYVHSKKLKFGLYSGIYVKFFAFIHQICIC